MNTKWLNTKEAAFCKKILKWPNKASVIDLDISFDKVKYTWFKIR